MKAPLLLATTIACLGLASAQVVPPPSSSGAAPGLSPNQLSAGQAVRTVHTLPGAQNFRTVLEISGEYGVPQPESWSVLSFSPDTPDIARLWWADASSAADEGRVELDWIRNAPTGYVSLDRWRIDSIQAFSLAEAAAARAEVGFDRADFLLRAQELTNEPLWIISLFNRREQCVGIVQLSGEDGEILRTVWFDSGLRDRGFAGIEDSLAPGAAAPVQPSLPQPNVNLPRPNVDIAAPGTATTRPAPDPRGSVPRDQPTLPPAPQVRTDPDPSSPPAAPAPSLLPGEVPAVSD